MQQEDDSYRPRHARRSLRHAALRFRRRIRRLPRRDVLLAAALGVATAAVIAAVVALVLPEAEQPGETGATAIDTTGTQRAVAYDEEVVDEAKNDVRVVLHLHPALAPYKAAILPLSKKLSEPARKIYEELSKEWMIDFDETGSIGKRYRREDEVGTPYCITVDFDTVGDAEKAGDNCVTVRERDSMEQVRIPMSEVKNYIAERIKF